MTCLVRRRLILMDLQNKLNEILRMASIEAYNLKSEYVSTEHILLAISKNDSLVKKVLLESGGNYEAILQTVIENSGEGTSEKPPEGYDNLVHERGLHRGRPLRKLSARGPNPGHAEGAPRRRLCAPVRTRP